MATNTASKLRALVRELSEKSDEIKRIVDEGMVDLTDRKRENLDKALAEIAETLSQTRYRLDPAKHEIITITLGRPDALSRFFAFNFIEKPRLEFSTVADSKFYGSGAYALYYTGNEIEPYLPLSQTETPIYVGKAIPGSPTAETAFDQGPAVWRRLKEHHKSIRSGGLDPSDFQFRYAVIQSGMESAVEDFMIRLFKPIWNKEIKVCFGIGKHGDAATTRRNRRSPWDTMHPGRSWAEATAKDQSSRASIIANIAKHFAANTPISDKEAMYKILAL